MPRDHQVSLARRDFLKLGTGSALALTAASTVSLIQGCQSAETKQTLDVNTQFLRPKDIVILSAVSPAVLKGNFPSDPEAQQSVLRHIILDIDNFLASSTKDAQKKVHELFDLMYFPPTRIAVVGLWSSWEDASIEEINTFLKSWNTSRFNLLRQGYILLAMLPSLAFYYEPSNWTAEIYPGPPQHVPS